MFYHIGALRQFATKSIFLQNSNTKTQVKTNRWKKIKRVNSGGANFKSEIRVEEILPFRFSSYYTNFSTYAQILAFYLTPEMVQIKPKIRPGQTAKIIVIPTAYNLIGGIFFKISIYTNFVLILGLFVLYF